MRMKEYICKTKNKYSIEYIKENFEKFSKLNILVIGDPIIDQYTFVKSKGRAVKDPILSVEYINHETYAGGVLAIANHISDFVNKIKLVTIIGDKRDKKDFIINSLSKNTDTKFFIKKILLQQLKKDLLILLRIINCLKLNI